MHAANLAWLPYKSVLDQVNGDARGMGPIGEARGQGVIGGIAGMAVGCGDA